MGLGYWGISLLTLLPPNLGLSPVDPEGGAKRDCRLERAHMYPRKNKARGFPKAGHGLGWAGEEEEK